MLSVPMRASILARQASQPTHRGDSMRTFSATAVSAVVLTVLGATAKAEVPVLVMPFADASGNGAKWVESSIQQSLVGDVGRGGTFKAVAAPSTGKPSDDLAV